MTISAQRFVATVAPTWGKAEWADAASGLSGSDAATLRTICQEEGESYETAENEVAEMARLKAGLPTR